MPDPPKLNSVLAIAADNTMDDSELLAAFGTVTIEPFQPNESVVGRKYIQLGEHFRYTWRPAEENGDLPPGFSLSLDCLVSRTADGHPFRRFTPSDEGEDDFIVSATAAGLAALIATRDFDHETRSIYRAMSLFFQQSRHLQEWLNRRFARIGDLLIAESVRISGEPPDILPSNLGLDRLGNGERWPAVELIRRGRKLAEAAGDNAPDEETCIRHGLIEAARANPLDPEQFSSDGVEAIVRLSLFDYDGGVDPEVKALIIERILKALDRHLDDSREKFRNWFFDNVDNIVHQVAKRKAIAEVASRDDVRRVTCDIGFMSFRYVGQCVDSAMRAFRLAMPEPLSADERQLFDLLYGCHCWLADIPLILLNPRFPQLREIIIEMLSDPGNRQLIGVLQRLLVYYGEMASARRQADRDYKRRSQHHNDDGRSAISLELQEEDRPASEDRGVVVGGQRHFQEIVSELRERRRARCQCGHHRHWSARILESKTDERIVTIVDGCQQCGCHEEIPIPRSHFEAVAKWVIDDQTY
jgi:hypothetical protein